MDILEKICENKKKEIEFEKSKYSFNTLEKLVNIKPNKGFSKLLINKQKLQKNNIVAEIKKSSPSAGNIIKDYNPIIIAKEYEKAGVHALSILTEKKYFEGDIEHISSVKKYVQIPILRKDFIIDPYQVIQSKFYEVDAILIIMSIVSTQQAEEIIDVAKKYQIDCLVEVHKKDEIDKALKLNNPIIGINNRNLKNLSINLNNTKELSEEIPDNYTIIAESGIKNKDDIIFYNDIGIFNFLIGEMLLKSKNITSTIHNLI